MSEREAYVCRFLRISECQLPRVGWPGSNMVWPNLRLCAGAASPIQSETCASLSGFPLGIANSEHEKVT